MRWKGRRVSTNVEDRRGGGGVKTGGISIIGLVVAFIAWKFFGVDPQQAYQATQAVISFLYYPILLLLFCFLL